MKKTTLQKWQKDMLNQKGRFVKYAIFLLIIFIMVPTGSIAIDVLRLVLSLIPFIPVLMVYIMCKADRTEEEEREIRLNTILLGVTVFACILSFFTTNFLNQL